MLDPKKMKNFLLPNAVVVQFNKKPNIQVILLCKHQFNLLV